MAIDQGTISYALRMVVTHGFSNSSEQFLRDLYDLGYNEGYDAGVADATAAATQEAAQVLSTAAEASEAPSK
jgi:hypothetical protein